MGVAVSQVQGGTEVPPLLQAPSLKPQAPSPKPYDTHNPRVTVGEPQASNQSIPSQTRSNFNP